MDKKKKIMLGLLGVVAVLIAIFSFVLLNANSGNEPSNNDNNNEEQEVEKEPEPTLQILDLDNKKRPIAVMIDNNVRARPHSGLQDAYLVYEAIVEGGQTRLMALFHDQDTSIVGPVRSTRHYFIDYVLEHDAIFAHFGGSPQAYTDLSRLNVANIDGMVVSGTYYRDSSRRAPHNAYTTMENLNTRISNSSFRENMSNEHVLNYSIDKVDLQSVEGVLESRTPSFSYSSSHTSSYVYDEENEVYVRSMNGNPHTDRETGDTYTFKNIIGIYVENFGLDGTGRQDLRTVTSGNGYFISEGYAVPINFEKTSRAGQTSFTLKDGTPLEVNDGNTLIQVFPKGRSMSIN